MTTKELALATSTIWVVMAAVLVMFYHYGYWVCAFPAGVSARVTGGIPPLPDLGMLGSSGITAYRDPVANAVAAVTAGSDMVLMIAGSTPATAPAMAAGIAQAVTDGTLPAERLEDAAVHVMTLRMKVAEQTTP